MASLSKDNRLTWTCALTGKQKKITLGTVPKKTAEVWKRRVEELIDAVRHGEEPPRDTREWLRGLTPALREKLATVGLLGPGGGKPTALEAFVLAFIADKEGTVKPATKSKYEQVKTRTTAFFGNDRDIRTITVGDAMAFSAWLRQEAPKGAGLGENTARKRCADFSVMLAWAVAHEAIGKNPFADKRIPKMVGAAGADRRHHLPHKDAVAIMEACRQMENLELAAMFALCRWGGLRAGECLLLRWDEVDWEKGRFTVLSPKTEHHQGKDRRVVPLFPEIERALLPLQEKAAVGEKRVLPSFKTTQWGAKSLKVACKRAGVATWKRIWQNLRATRATELADCFPPYLCAEWLGHSNEVADQNYRRATEEHFAAAAQFETGGVDAESEAETKAQNQAQDTPERGGSKGNSLAPQKKKALVFKGFSRGLSFVQNRQVGTTGLEPVTRCV